MITQIGIGIFGLTAIWLSQDQRESWRRCACLSGMAGQPFWFHATFTTEQWGIFVLAFFYTWAWGRGVWHHWIKGSKFLKGL